MFDAKLYVTLDLVRRAETCQIDSGKIELHNIGLEPSKRTCVRNFGVAVQFIDVSFFDSKLYLWPFLVRGQ